MDTGMYLLYFTNINGLFQLLMYSTVIPSPSDQLNNDHLHKKKLYQLNTYFTRIYSSRYKIDYTTK